MAIFQDQEWNLTLEEAKCRSEATEKQATNFRAIMYHCVGLQGTHSDMHRDTEWMATNS